MQSMREINRRLMENEMFGISMPLLSQSTMAMEVTSLGVDQTSSFPTDTLSTQSQTYYLSDGYPLFSTLQEASAINVGLSPPDLLLSAPAPSIPGSFSASNNCAFEAEDEEEILVPRRWSLEEQMGQQLLQARFSNGSGDPYPYGVPANELSLTLGSHRQSDTEMAGVGEQCSEMSCSRVTRVGSKDKIYSHESRDPVLSSRTELSSAYLHAANQMLAEIAVRTLDDRYNKSLDPDDVSARRCSSLSSSSEQKPLKTELMSMLQMIDRGYDECVDRVQDATAAFRKETGSSPSHTPAHFALHTVSAHYQRLRDRISSQIQKLNREFELEAESLNCSFLQRQWELQQLKSENQPWRSQRGLPEKSVAVLRSWMFQNFLHPYPRDSEKQLLAVKSGLTRSQVSNWFINARVRLWKPMIEEMYQETSRKARGEEDGA